MSDTECAKCKKSLAGGSVLTALKMKWHSECFVCTGCKAQLANQTFHSKEDGPYCANCFKDKFQPKCEMCHVVMEPSVQFLKYNDKAYHKECFVCSECRVSLADEKFCIKDNKYYCSKHV